MLESACPFCDEIINNRNHYEFCKKSPAIKRHAKHAIHFEDEKTLCFKCFKTMKATEYINHNRNCGRKQKKLSEGNSDRFEVSSFSLIGRPSIATTSKLKNAFYQELGKTPVQDHFHS